MGFQLAVKASLALLVRPLGIGGDRVPDSVPSPTRADPRANWSMRKRRCAGRGAVKRQLIKNTVQYGVNQTLTVYFCSQQGITDLTGEPTLLRYSETPVCPLLLLGYFSLPMLLYFQ